MDNENKYAAKLQQARNNMFVRGGQIAAHAVTGGVGKVARMEAQRKLSGAISSAAEKTAERYKKQKGEEMDGDEKRKKLQGFGFWIVFGLVVVQEVVNIVFDFTVILSLLTTIFGLMVTFIVYFYLAMEGVSFNEKRLTMWLISILIEMVPFLNLIPAFPIMLLVMKAMETSDFLQNKIATAEKVAV